MENLFENRTVKLNKVEIKIILKWLDRRVDQIMESNETTEEKLRMCGSYKRLKMKITEAL